MTQATWRILGNAMLAVAAVLLLVILSGMVGLTPRLAATRELTLLGLVLAVSAGAVRRRSAPAQE